jgi:hypothetical protein
MTLFTVHRDGHNQTTCCASCTQPPGADCPHTGHHADGTPQKTARGPERKVHQETTRTVKHIYIYIYAHDVGLLLNVIFSKMQEIRGYRKLA